MNSQTTNMRLSSIQFERRFLEKDEQDLLDRLRAKWRVPTRNKDSFLKFDTNGIHKRIQDIFRSIDRKKGLPMDIPIELMLFMNGTFVGDVNLRYYMRDAPPLEDLIQLFCIIRRNITQYAYECDMLQKSEFAFRGADLRNKKRELSCARKLDEEFKRWFVQMTNPDVYGYCVRCYSALYSKTYDEGRKKVTRSDFKRECKMYSVDPAKIKKFSRISVLIDMVVKGDIQTKTIDEFWSTAAELEGISQDKFKDFVKAHMYDDDYPLWLSGKLQEEEAKQLYAQALQKQHANSYAESKALKTD